MNNNNNNKQRHNGANNRNSVIRSLDVIRPASIGASLLLVSNERRSGQEAHRVRTHSLNTHVLADAV